MSERTHHDWQGCTHDGWQKGCAVCEREQIAGMARIERMSPDEIDQQIRRLLHDQPAQISDNVRAIVRRALGAPS